MTMSIARLSVRSGLKYLFKSTMLDDFSPTPPDTISYYVKTGTPQGLWLGSGLRGIARTSGENITESDARAIFQDAAHPDSKEPLGRPHGQAPIDQKTNGHNATKHAVAGFDLTFSVPKSVSTLWALSPRPVQEQILGTHHEAIEATLAWMEEQVINTRAGRNGVAHVGTRGVIAAAFDHWESRAGDPQLHTHLVIANRVQRITDGAWVTVDSRSLYKAVVAASEHYNGLLFDALQTSLGTETDVRVPAQNSHNPSQQLTGIAEALIREFSTRSRLIDIETDRLVNQWITEHGARPTATTIVRLRQQATLSTRTPKNVEPSPLRTLSAQWRARAMAQGFDPESVVASTIRRSRSRPFHVGDFAPDWIDAVGLVTRRRVAAKRSTWNRWNLIAEGERVCAEIRCASPADRNGLIDAVATAAERQSVPLNQYWYGVPADAADDLRFAGRSVFDFHGSRLYTDESTLAFEDEILAAKNDDGGPAVPVDLAFGALTSYRNTGGSPLHDDQLTAASDVLLSSSRLDAIVGPAGTGKTTTLGAVKAAWEATYGMGSVIGLAPAAASAEVLGSELRMVTENVAKWLHESVGSGAAGRAGRFFQADDRLRRASVPLGPIVSRLQQEVARLAAEQNQWLFRPNQLVIVDEASMVSTLQLAALVCQATDVGAKILLVGDPAQLDSIDAGGVLGWLDRQGKAARLSTIWRFKDPWERSASLGLREGRVSVLAEYEDHGRISHGHYSDMVDHAYSAWHADILAGRVSVLIAPDNETVQMLNERAQADRVGLGAVDAERTVVLRDGLRAGRGDIVIARRNDRSIRDDQGEFLRNGTLLEVTGVDRFHGALRAIRKDTAGALLLPSNYVQASMELGYATTAHRSQGLTVDTGHTVVTPGRLTRELLYVSMTRGRHSNTAYVSENDPDEDELLDPSARSNWRVILSEVLAAEGAERTAHEVRDFERQHADSLERLHREYDYLAQIAAGLDFAKAIDGIMPGRSEDMRESPAWGAAVAAWRRASSANRAGALRTLNETLDSEANARDLTAVIHARLRRFCSAVPQMPIDPLTEQLPTDRPDLTVLLDQVRRRIGNRAEHVANAVLRDEPEWAKLLRKDIEAGADPFESAAMLRDVAVYRDRWGVNSAALALGPTPADWEWEQRAQWDHLRQEITQAATPEPGLTDVGNLYEFDSPISLTSTGWQL
ncbi:MobF family relaxase [Paenarthrobacter aurescens]|uniref:TraA/ATP-dependent exoDNAse/relaxase n=1 Tax=Paenarthrobacter aurescens TaxID=43663 RepID=A0A4Y3NGC0_PAEAU|nr:MobF family relaxase [Paenarthrobacter aurescens]MDO6143378.1 relaxase domain-containing protein [Paenarthrobacter aurescens]MDO6147226.1 relaxase domain-containing protein [Paenarthrobacter aurescens]MDO6158470.1 relaxase domain-containing protein [Paenarthrobacter aurescens]MDO6162454.1 relaxase domain-containing protein [Paenarthrobacter aurescens]GEB18196.1 TraA/ATP-dependent exoDNAse/relaxase [Paenarthrobacter aurescens]